MLFMMNQAWQSQCRNKDGLLWASVLAGPRGFLKTSKPTKLVANPMTRLPGDPAELNVGDHIGTLAIKLETRQRERVNGVVSENVDGQIAIAVEQSFSGCPKYIQGRGQSLWPAILTCLGRRINSPECNKRRTYCTVAV